MNKASYMGVDCVQYLVFHTLHSHQFSNMFIFFPTAAVLGKKTSWFKCFRHSRRAGENDGVAKGTAG